MEAFVRTVTVSNDEEKDAISQKCHETKVRACEVLEYAIRNGEYVNTSYDCIRRISECGPVIKITIAEIPCEWHPVKGLSGDMFLPQEMVPYDLINSIFRVRKDAYDLGIKKGLTVGEEMARKEFCNKYDNVTLYIRDGSRFRKLF